MALDLGPLPDPPRNRDYVFIHIPKCGGRSIRWALGKSTGAAANRVDHADVRDQIARMGRDNWDRLYTFAAVRDPYERLVSCYAWTQERGHIPDPTPQTIEAALGEVVLGEQVVDFNDPEKLTHIDRFKCWVYGGCPLAERMNFRVNPARANWIHAPQTDWLVDDAGEIAVRHLLRVEKLEDEWLRIAEALGAEERIKHLNCSDHGKPAEYYDEPTRALVRKRYARDFDLLGYE